MRRFRFRLASLERLMAHREEEAKVRAARAAIERRRAAELLGHLHGRVASVQGEQQQRRADQRLSPREELEYQTYFDGMRRVVARQEQELARAAERHEARQRELLEAARRRRTLGLLREQRLAEHRREGLRQFTRVLDEAGARMMAGTRQPGAYGPEEPSPAA